MAALVSCLGPIGSYSELAAKKLCPDREILLCKNFPEVVSALVTGKTDDAVLPIENAIQGGVLQNLDLMETEDVFAVEQTVIPIDHRLIKKPGVPLSAIERVYSHEQAIGQCSAFLGKYLPAAQCVFTDSTAKSVGLVDDRSAGIVGSHVRAEGLELSSENIANDKGNCTQFVRLRRREEGLPQRCRTVFFSAVCDHRPGSLLQLLDCFARVGINLTKIESRPIRGVYGEYRFFIAADGDLSDGKVRDALEKARSVCRTFRLLGAY